MTLSIEDNKFYQYRFTINNNNMSYDLYIVLVSRDWNLLILLVNITTTHHLIGRYLVGCNLVILEIYAEVPKIMSAQIMSVHENLKSARKF